MAIVQFIPDEAFAKRLTNLIKSYDDPKSEYKHSNHLACVTHAEEMAWHVYGTKPERLLKMQRPREDPAILAYRLQSYEPITKSVCKKGISIVHKIFNPKLSAIRFQDSTEAKKLKGYTEEYYPRFNSLTNYMASFALKKVIADPNGVFLAQPYKYVLKGNEYVSPILTCYPSKDIHIITDDFALLFDDYKEEGTFKRWYYTLCDLNVIYKLVIEQNNGQKITITTTDSYVHNFQELPLWHLMGEYSEKQYGMFESFFYPAVPFWNEAINDHSDVNGNYRMHINSQKWELGEECEFVERTDQGNYSCDGGYIFNSIKGEKHKCPSCAGTGRKKTATGPYDVYQVDRSKAFEGDNPIPLPPFGYVAPPVEGLKMLEEKAERNLEKGLNALNMDVVNKIGENQSGVAKEQDRTELNDFLQKLADVFFDVHLTNAYYFFAKFMFGVVSPEKIQDIEPEISKPTQFDVYSTLELTNQFAEAKTAKLNPSYLSVKQAEIQSKEFQNYPDLLNTLNLELALDPLAEVSREDVSLMIANGTIKKTTAIIHDNIRMFIRKAMNENKTFAEMDFEKQVEVLEKYAEEVEEETKVVIDTSAFETPPTEPPIKKEGE